MKEECKTGTKVPVHTNFIELSRVYTELWTLSNYSVADEPEDCVLPGEEDVMDIAEAWTLNPLYLTEIPGIKAYRITQE